MPSYEVRLPFAGYVYVRVEADSEREAIDEAIDSAELHIKDRGSTDLGEWEFMEHISHGNFSCVPLSSADAELIDDDDTELPKQEGEGDE